MPRKMPFIWENTDNKPVSLSTVFQWALRHGRANRLLATERSFLRRPLRVGVWRRIDKRSYKPGLRENARRVFGDYLIKTFEARCWPGTMLIGHTGRVYLARFDEKLASRMIAIEDELFNWLNSSPKKLVEDLCLFREGAAYPVFASVTHEKVASVISTGPISLRGFEKTDYSPNEAFVAWEGKYFCWP